MKNAIERTNPQDLTRRYCCSTVYFPLSEKSLIGFNDKFNTSFQCLLDIWVSQPIGVDLWCKQPVGTAGGQRDLTKKKYRLRKLKCLFFCCFKTDKKFIKCLKLRQKMFTKKNRFSTSCKKSYGLQKNCVSIVEANFWALHFFFCFQMDTNFRKCSELFSTIHQPKKM